MSPKNSEDSGRLSLWADYHKSYSHIERSEHFSFCNPPLTLQHAKYYWRGRHVVEVGSKLGLADYSVELGEAASSYVCEAVDFCLLQGLKDRFDVDSSRFEQLLSDASFQVWDYLSDRVIFQQNLPGKGQPIGVNSRTSYSD